MGNNDGPPEDYRNLLIKALGAGILGAEAYDKYREFMDNLQASKPDKLRSASVFAPAPPVQQH